MSEDPEKIFNAAFMFEGQSWFSEILKKAVEAVEKKDPQAVLNFFEGYQKEVWAKDVVERIAQKSPQIALMYADRYQGMPWAAEIIWSSAKRDPWSAYAYEKNFSSIYAQDSAAGRELKEEMDRLKERIRLTIKEMASDTSRDSGIYQRALGIYKNAKEDSSFKYWELKRSVANQFSKVDPIGLVGFLNTAYVGDLLAVSQITGIDPEFIMAVYAQEGAALLHRWKEYNSKEIVDAYDGVGMDNVYALLPALLKNGLPVEYEKVLNYRKNESGMILRSVSIKEKEALKAIAGVLQILQNQLKNDVTE